MKSAVISSVVITSCAILAAATPSFRSESAVFERELASQGIDAREFYEFLARGNSGSRIAQSAAKQLERKVSTGKSAMASDEKDKTKQAAKDALLGGNRPATGPGPFQKASTAISAANAFKEAGNKARLDDANARASAHQSSRNSKTPKREFFDEELGLFARGNSGSKIAQSAAKQLERKVSTGKSAMASDEKDKTKQAAKDALLGGNRPATGPGPFQKASTAISAANAFKEAGNKARLDDANARASAHQSSRNSKVPKREFFDEELGLFARGNSGSKIAQSAAKQLERKVSTGKSAMASDEKDKTKQAAKDALLGGNRPATGPGPFQKASTAISAANAFKEAGKKARLDDANARASAHQSNRNSKVPKREFFDDDLEFEARDFEDEFFTREYGLDELE